MPKIISEAEKAHIRRRLKEEAAFCLAGYGVKGTTVDELVKRVNIPKGTFYLFYESKELLLFEVLMEWQSRLHAQLLEQMKELQDFSDPDRITGILYDFFKQAETSGYVKLMGARELELLYRKLPRSALEGNEADDEALVKEILKLFCLDGQRDSAVFATAFRGLFLTMLYKREIGESDFDGALRLLIRGLVLQMIGSYGD